jgi:hypothetical protein
MISIVTPSVRKEGLLLNKQSLQRQTLSDFEWIVISPFKYEEADIWIPDPPKREGDFYSLCKAYNAGFKAAKGELIVSYQDQIEMEPTTLERFWTHYQANPKACIGAIGHQYENGIQVWADPRQTDRYGSFYECNPIDIEFTLASLPRQAIYDVGGFDEEWDKYAATGEKEMLLRIDKAGYPTYLDQSILYKAEHHPRLTKDWDERYKLGSVYYQECVSAIINGERPIKSGSLK